MVALAERLRLESDSSDRKNLVGLPVKWLPVFDFTGYSVNQALRGEATIIKSSWPCRGIPICQRMSFVQRANHATRGRKISEVPSSRLQLIVYVSVELKLHPIRRLWSFVFYRASNRHTLGGGFYTCAGHDDDCMCFHIQCHGLHIRRRLTAVCNQAFRCQFS